MREAEKNYAENKKRAEGLFEEFSSEMDKLEKQAKELFEKTMNRIDEEKIRQIKEDLK